MRYLNHAGLANLGLDLAISIAACTMLLGCIEKTTCPSHKRMVVGASCNGEDLQCAYEVPVYNCDGTISTVDSSCSCSAGKWVCPAVVEPACAQPAVGVDNETSNVGTSATSVADGGGQFYSTGADAGTTSRASRTSRLRGSSCPLIYVRSGDQFVYETDVGGLTIGIPPSATANHAIPIPGGGTFYHLLPRAQYDASTGLELLIRESVNEISYIDEAKLVVVDHPLGTELWSSGDESTNEWGYQSPFRIYTGQQPRAPISATDRLGRNVLAALKDADNRTAPVVTGTYDNEYTLDFGPITAPQQAKLIIEGWSIYRYRAERDVQPFVEAEAADGTWVLVTKFGAPYGDYKSIAVDLSNGLPPSARRLRVTLGMEAGARWVIDRIRVDESAPVEVTTQVLEASVAELVHRGRATLNRNTLKSRQDALDDAFPDEEIQLGYGAFTRYGDVRELLTAVDDRYVIMRHGDQISLRFPGGLAPAPGMARSIVLKIDVMMKAFFFERNVEPLPFHGMSSYPYPATEHYPTDEQHLDFINRYNSRTYAAP